MVGYGEMFSSIEVVDYPEVSVNRIAAELIASHLGRDGALAKRIIRKIRNIFS